jgi:hypothetical protein
MSSLEGETKNPTLAAMRRAGVPLTRENFIYWAFGGEPAEGEIDREADRQDPMTSE